MNKKLFLIHLVVNLYRVIQVLPPDRKHPLLIDFKSSKNSGMIVYRCTFCKNFKFFNVAGNISLEFNNRYIHL
jgi:hypothetical protein